MLYRSFLVGLVAVVLATLVALPAAAQSLTSGDISGVVTDPSGAAVSNAAVTLKNKETGSTEVRNSSPQGAYRVQRTGRQTKRGVWFLRGVLASIDLERVAVVNSVACQSRYQFALW